MVRAYDRAERLLRRRLSDPVSLRIVKGAAAGLVAGLVATAVMTAFQGLISAPAPEGSLRRRLARKLSPEDHASRQHDRGSPQSAEGDPATAKAADAVSQAVLARPLSREEKHKAGQAVHYGFGTMTGAVYGALAEEFPRTTKAAGTAYGAALWLLADEIAVPAAGLAPGPTRVPLTTHVSALAAHLVYGATAEAVRRAVRRML